MPQKQNETEISNISNITKTVAFLIQSSKRFHLENNPELSETIKNK